MHFSALQMLDEYPNMTDHANNTMESKSMPSITFFGGVRGISGAQFHAGNAADLQDIEDHGGGKFTRNNAGHHCMHPFLISAAQQLAEQLISL